MKDISTFSWCILALFAAVSCAELNQPENKPAYNKSQIEALTNTMKIMLKIDPPKNGKNLIMKKLPKHMQELYDRYTKEKPSVRETVRSIEPLKDFVPHFKDVLVYNLSSVSRFEKVKSAQLHIFRRRLMPQKGDSRKKLLPPPCRVRIYQLLTTPGPSVSYQPMSTENTLEVDAKELSETERTKLRSLDTVPVAQMTRGGWYTIEISMALKEMLNSPGATSNLIFGVRFEGPRGKSISPEHFLKEPNINISSSYVVVFSEDSTDSDAFSYDNDNRKLNSRDAAIMAELLEKYASKNKMKDINENKRQYFENDVSSKNRHSKRKFKKINDSSNEEEIDAIRHGKKYYGDGINQRRKFNRKNHHHTIKASMGNGDISELVNYEKVKKAIALRRHNHKSVNSLNLRYDSSTKSLIQRKTEMSDDENDEIILNKTRKSRSVHDNTVSDYVIEFVEEEEEEKNAKTKLNKSGNEEYEKEDDMGDLSYYEPDVFVHESSIPRSYRHKYYESDNYGEYGRKKIASRQNTLEESTNTVLTDEDDVIKRTKNSDDREISQTSTIQDIAEKKSRSEVLNSDADEWVNLITTEISATQESVNKETTKGDKRRHKNRWNRYRKVPKKTQVPKTQKEKSECHLSKLDVNVADLDISDSIIAPSILPIGICSGNCQMSENTDAWNECSNLFTNHAMIQYELSKSTRYRVSEPCCTPEKMSSLLTLYLDHESHVVLKTFPDIVVESCKCR